MNTHAYRDQDRRRPGADPEAVMVSALAAAERGWYVFPAIPGTKRPLWHNWPAHVTRDPARIRSYAGWRPGGRTGRGCDNVAIACKPSGLVVLDPDRPKPGQETPPPQWRLPGVVDGADVLAVLAERAGQPFPWDTHTVATRRGGMHLYFTAPKDVVILNDSNGKTGWLLDVRAPGRPESNGGYVIAAGSFVEADENGPAGTYTTLDPGEAIPLPAWLTDILAHTEPAVPARTPLQLRTQIHQRAPYAERALACALDDVLGAVAHDQGGRGRNHTLNRAAYRLRRLVAAGLLPEHLVVAALTDAALATGLDQREATATIRSGLGAP